MIQQLSNKYSWPVAYCLFLVFLGTMVPPHAFGRSPVSSPWRERTIQVFEHAAADRDIDVAAILDTPGTAGHDAIEAPEDIGGPSQPEMASFRSVGTDNMVNLFTGDFSYNIPLLDVGGYPVNIFYDGGITMEQEASWVGLGWNINPGTVSRNMRGVPDDFNGKDTLVQRQAMKPNRTWGINLTPNMEKFGKSLFTTLFAKKDLSLGFSYNNYLGPALEFGFRGSLNFSIMGKVQAEKDGKTVDTSNLIGSIGAPYSISLNSRSGLSIAASASLTAHHKIRDRAVSHGLTLATSYNSKTGVRALQLSEQSRFNVLLSKKEGGSQNIGTPRMSTSITFARPTYIPAIRMPVTNTAFTGNVQLGTGILGGYVAGQAEVYLQQASVEAADVMQKKPMVGYMYNQAASKNAQAVMDFTRLNDGAVTQNTTIISAPQYAYDVFSIQGEGTGGSVRAYRYDDGYMRDNETRSQDRNIAIGADIGPPGHFGANFNEVWTPAIITEWQQGNKLRNAIGFKENNQLNESVYFRNPGETSVMDDNEYTRLGGDSLVRFKLGGTNANPAIEPILERFSRELVPAGETNIATAARPSGRARRSQVISFLTASEAAGAGLDRIIKSYRADTLLTDNNSLKYDSMPRVSDYRQAHHISQVNVTEANGMRYVYGIPVYNVTQKDLVFTIENIPVADAYTKDKASFSLGDTSVGHVTRAASDYDGYYQETITPAYAHSFLLSGLLSPDYVDVNGDGITEDDLGNAVKFNYTRIKNGGSWADHKWRTPMGAGTEANFNAGALTENKDDKGVIAYGERESWYLHSIESKTLIAIFTLANRDDGKGVTDQWSGVDVTGNSLKRLQQIDLYSKADLKKNGRSGAKPVKSVHFTYSYSLCHGAPGNANGEGKLTLESIHFTFNGQSRAKPNKYVFGYNDEEAGNPAYELNGSDRWSSYKPKSSNPQDLRNADYPYTLQGHNNRAELDRNAGAWNLKKILLPSGGQIEVTYESDDYAFVQDRRAAVMMQVAGFGSNPSSFYPELYANRVTDLSEHDHAFIHVPVACANKQEVFQRYIRGQEQLMIKMAVIMPKGIEYIPAYASIADYGVYSNDANIIWIKAQKRKGVSPFALAAIEYLREHLPGQAWPGYDIKGQPLLTQVIDMFKGMGNALSSAFQDPVNYLRARKGLARRIVPEKTFARLNEPGGFKYGGGHRVKMIKLKDNWKAMTQQDSSVYGQVYTYTTTEVFNGQVRTISSGVASYEPSLGGDENPMQRIEMVADKLPLGPTTYGAIELPFLDAFFPSPVVGYSKVTVRSLRKGSVDKSRKARSAIGKQVTEFYTAKDFPYTVLHTGIDPSSNRIFHSAPVFNFLKKSITDRRAVSQGFLVVTNDMHGKMKSQSSYSAMDSVTPVNYSENFYRNTGRNGMEDKFDFVHAKEGGVIREGRMGVDIELMTDTREFSVMSRSAEFQFQLDFIPAFVLPPWFPFPWNVNGESENTYRAVTVTKVINFHGVLDSVLVIDKGSRVSTRNLVYDSETGQVVVTRTNNEFDQPVYNTSYPAWWAYSGMGPAYKNIDAVYRNVNFLGGQIVSGITAELKDIFESGDELLLLNTGITPGDDCGAALKSSESIRVLWAFDRDKQNGSLTNTTPEFVFMDSAGKPYTRYGMDFRIIRSGKRNLLGESLASVTTLLSPVAGTTNRTLDVTGALKVVNAGAAEFRERWQADNDVIRTLVAVYEENTCTIEEIEDCSGYLEKNINPYRKGLLGNFRAWRSMVYYDTRADSSTSVPTDISKDGVLKPDFALYWNFDGNGNLVPDQENAKWVWNSQVTRVNAKGMELETRDALDIYTSAVYGYQRTLPVAIANNGRVHEIAFSSFEDGDYESSLNNARYTLCGKPSFDFFGFSNATIRSSLQTGFAAHTGKHMLEVDTGQSASVVVPVSNEPADSFSLAMATDMLKQLSILGGTLSKVSSIPSGAPVNAPSFSASDLGMSVDFGNHAVDGQYLGSETRYLLHYSTSQYTEITSAKKYSFTLSTNITDATLGHPSLYTTLYSAMSLEIISMSTNETVALFEVNNSNSPKTDSVFLPCDIYRIVCFLSADIQRPSSGPTDISFHNFHTSFGYTSNTGSTSYRSMLLEEVCEYFLPIRGDSSMFNPVFTVPRQKKMLFSAWVKEPCVSGPCTGYANNKVVFHFDSNLQPDIELKPAGPVIEGWQRYEGVFTAPEDATAMTVSLVNLSATQKLYFDDIRIHPFNANMKSYIYDPVNLRLLAELDPNNYARYYEYDEEGTLTRTKAETKNGIKTITETRSARQKDIETPDP